MPNRTIKMTKGDLTTTVVESAFLAVWQPRGWKRAAADAEVTHKRDLGVHTATQAGLEAAMAGKDPRKAFDEAYAGFLPQEEDVEQALTQPNYPSPPAGGVLGVPAEGGSTTGGPSLTKPADQD